MVRRCHARRPLVVHCLGATAAEAALAPLYLALALALLPAARAEGVEIVLVGPTLQERPARVSRRRDGVHGSGDVRISFVCDLYHALPEPLATPHLAIAHNAGVRLRLSPWRAV